MKQIANLAGLINKKAQRSPRTKPSRKHRNLTLQRTETDRQEIAVNQNASVVPISHSNSVAVIKQYRKDSNVSINGLMYVKTKRSLLLKKNNNKTLRVKRRRLDVKTKERSKELCLFYNKFGKCNHQDTCKFIHDLSKVSVCRRFLAGKCVETSCLLQHKVITGQMPACDYFQRGLCTRESCPYSHVHVNPNAKLCEAYLKGYCPEGDKCKLKHSSECQEFRKTGVCSTKDCKLQHKKTKKNKTANNSRAKKKIYSNK